MNFKHKRNVEVIRSIKLGAVLGLSIMLFGCSDDDNKVEIQAPAPEPNTVFDVASANGSFNTLVSLLEATNLDDTLDNANSTFTVFAPTDEAFAALGQETLDALAADPDKLSSILTYHVLGSKVEAQAALSSAGNTVETVNGANIALSLSGENLLINTSTVTATDVMADNGVIHVIDSVLMPPAPTESNANIVATAKANGNFNTLIAALERTGLDSVLSDDSGTFTVFAPTDAAFAAIGDKLINTLLANPDVLSDILKQHVLPINADSVTAMSLNGKSVKTVLENELGISINPETDSLMFGGAKIVTKDIVTTNGTIHVIDSVIVGDVTLPQSFGTIADVASENGSFNTLVSLLAATGLDSEVSDPTKTFTVFAPTDAAFTALGQETLTALQGDTEALKNILLYHVIAEQKVMSDAAISVANSEESLVAMGNGSNAALSTTGATLFINDSAISAANVMADNGVIHVLDKVIMPPKDMGEPTKNVVQTASDTDSLSTLVTALGVADLVDALGNPDANFTVFAPTNAAFKKIPSDTLNALLADKDALGAVLKQHVLASSVSSLNAFAANGAEVETLQGNKLSVNLVNFAGVSNTDSDVVTYSKETGTLVSGVGSTMAGKTLYVFDGDLENSMSQCVDTCATNWPPVTATADGIKNIPGLSLVERGDGSMQVAYLGRPLYTFIQDEAAGDMKGDAFNNVWWAVKLPTSGLQIEGANVTTTDIYTSNGVVHLIDTVITEVK
jgi:uncharacterized surface protein with fasciclin (FAS1) repeats